MTDPDAAPTPAPSAADLAAAVRSRRRQVTRPVDPGDGPGELQEQRHASSAADPAPADGHHDDVADHDGGGLPG